MRRILIVDDEPRFIEMVRHVLSSRFPSLEILEAPGAHEGLALLRQWPCDVVGSDLRMPGGDGIEFLTHVMQRHPDAVRILWSDHGDIESVLRSVGTAHQYLAKPGDFQFLPDVLDRIFNPRDRLSNRNLERLISQIQSLPSLPENYLELVEALNQDEPSLDRVAAVVARDMAMSAKLLQLVNSAFFGLRRRVTSIQEAVGFVGLTQLRSLLLYLHFILLHERVPIPGFSFEALWHHSSRVGKLASRIARVEGFDSDVIDQALLAGLLHDVGKVVLATGCPSQMLELKAKVRETPMTWFQAEMELWQTSHASVGAYLLSLWGLPRPVVDAVTWHHEPQRLEQSQPDLATIIHVADALDHETNGPLRGFSPTPLQTEHLDRLGCLPNLGRWRDFALGQ